MVTRGEHWVPNSASKPSDVPQRNVQSGGATNGHQLDNYTITLPGAHQSKVTPKGPPVSDHRKLRNVAQGATKDNNILRNKRPREEGRRANDIIDVDEIEGYPHPKYLTSFPSFLSTYSRSGRRRSAIPNQTSKNPRPTFRKTYRVAPRNQNPRHLALPTPRPLRRPLRLQRRNDPRI